jgi:transcriptional regulator with XRE-family HTH domain
VAPAHERGNTQAPPNPETLSELRRRTRILIGDNLGAYRARQRMSQQQLATRAKVTPTFLTAVENGQTKVSIDRLVNLAAGLGVTLSDLLQPPPEKQRIP